MVRRQKDLTTFLEFSRYSHFNVGVDTRKIVESSGAVAPQGGFEKPVATVTLFTSILDFQIFNSRNKNIYTLVSKFFGRIIIFEYLAMISNRYIVKKAAFFIINEYVSTKMLKFAWDSSAHQCVKTVSVKTMNLAAQVTILFGYCFPTYLYTD